MKPKNSVPEKVKFGNVTVKIYKRERPTASGEIRTVFEVADYTGGKRKLRGFSDPVEARTEAGRIARQLATGQSEAAAMSNSEAASYGRAMQLLQPTGVTLEVAVSHYAEAVKLLGGDRLIEAAKFFLRMQPDRLEQKPVQEVVTDLVALKQSRGLSADYVNDLRQRLTRFSGDFSVNISTITTSDVQRWLDGLALGPQSVKNFRTVLHTLFEFAEARGYIFRGSNPVASTEGVRVNGGKIEIFTPEEIGRLLKAASPAFLPFVAIGAFAGLRSAEVERIDWKDVDFAGGFITVASDKAKTKCRRLVPLSYNLKLWLAPYAGHTGKVWTGTPNDLQDARAECVKAANVPWKSNGLRHSFASYRLAEIQNAAQVALEMGNSADVVFRHYRELVKPSDSQKWFAVVPEQQPATVGHD